MRAPRAKNYYALQSYFINYIYAHLVLNTNMRAFGIKYNLRAREARYVVTKYIITYYNNIIHYNNNIITIIIL